MNYNIGIVKFELARRALEHHAVLPIEQLTELLMIEDRDDAWEFYSRGVAAAYNAVCAKHDNPPLAIPLIPLLGEHKLTHTSCTGRTKLSAVHSRLEVELTLDEHGEPRHERDRFLLFLENWASQWVAVQEEFTELLLMLLREEETEQQLLELLLTLFPYRERPTPRGGSRDYSPI